MPTNTDTLEILVGLVKDIGSKVDELTKDHVTKNDLSDLRRYIDDRIDRISDRYPTKDEVNIRIQALEKAVERLESLSLSETQRMLAHIGGIVGVVGGLVGIVVALKIF